METIQNDYYNRKTMRKLIFGVMVIAAGVLLLGFNLGFLPDQFRHIVFSWQMLLIAIGVVNIVSKDNWFSGVVLILVGGFFILPKLFFIPDGAEKVFWPFLLIMAGSLMIIRRTFFPSHHNWKDQLKKNDSTLDAGFIEETNIFGGSKKVISAQEFRGGKITNIFGGAEINLTQTVLAEGKNTLEVTCIFGGLSIIVPPDWVVHSEVVAIMGGFSDKRLHLTRQTGDSTRELFIKGTAIFGGGEVKGY